MNLRGNGDFHASPYASTARDGLSDPAWTVGVVGRRDFGDARRDVFAIRCRARGTPTWSHRRSFSVKRELNEPSDVHPTVMHAVGDRQALTQPRLGTLDAPGQSGRITVRASRRTLARNLRGELLAGLGDITLARRHGRHVERLRV